MSTIIVGIFELQKYFLICRDFIHHALYCMAGHPLLSLKRLILQTIFFYFPADAGFVRYSFG